MKKEKNRIEFREWVIDNITMILNTKELRLFKKMKMNCDDLKLFGKGEKAWDLFNSFEQDQFDWIVSTNLDSASLPTNTQWAIVQ